MTKTDISPLSFTKEEGVPVVLSPDNQDDHDSFVVALAGRKWNTNTKLWDNKLDGALKDQKGKGLLYRSNGGRFWSRRLFGRRLGWDEDSRARTKGYVSNGRGKDTIELSSSALQEIKEALSEDYGVATINSVEDQIKMIPNPYAFYVLQDDESGSGNVFSWNIIEILNNAD